MWGNTWTLTSAHSLLISNMNTIMCHLFSEGSDSGPLVHTLGISQGRRGTSRISFTIQKKQSQLHFAKSFQSKRPCLSLITSYFHLQSTDCAPDCLTQGFLCTWITQDNSTVITAVACTDPRCCKGKSRSHFFVYWNVLERYFLHCFVSRKISKNTLNMWIRSIRLKGHFTISV